MAYKDMNETYYYLATLGIWALEAIGGIVFKDISIVFNFLSAIGVTCISFWFPGGYYLMAYKRFSPDKQDNYVTSAKVYLVLGALNCIIGFAGGFIGIFAPPPPLS